MLRIGYKRWQSDHTLFIKSSENVTILIVYVDDIMLTGNSEKKNTSS